MMNILFGCAGIVALSMICLAYILIRNNRRTYQSGHQTMTLQRHRLLEELAQVNTALSRLGTGHQLALVKGANGQITSFHKDEFGTLKARK